MINPRRLAALALTACLIIQPVTGSAEAVMGTGLLSPTSYTAAVRKVKAPKPQTVAFNWLGNGASSASAVKSKAAQKRNRVITGQGTWICSPAGFGQRSHCHAG